MVTQRLDATTVLTHSGSIYKLIGDIEVADTVYAGNRYLRHDRYQFQFFCSTKWLTLFAYRGLIVSLNALV